MLIHKVPGTAYRADEHDLTVHVIDDASLTSDAILRRDPLFDEIADYGQYFGLSVLFPMIRALYEIRPEVVHARSGYYSEAALASELLGCPRVVVHFGSMTRENQFTSSEFEVQRKHVIEFICARLAQQSEVTFAANSAAAAEDWGQGLGIPQSKFLVMYNGLDEARLGIEAKATPATHGAEKVVGGVFRFYGVKDPMLWLKVAGRVADACPNIRFLLVGDGPLRDVMQERIDEMGLADRFEMPGVITEGLSEYYKRMDVFLLTSRTESLPNVVIEAQLAGVPVVAPDVGGIKEAIASSETGSVTKRDEEALANEVIRALNDDAWRHQVAATAPQVIRNRFSLDRLRVDLEHAYGWTAQAGAWLMAVGVPALVPMADQLYPCL